jgi:hypothetical protein
LGYSYIYKKTHNMKKSIFIIFLVAPYLLIAQTDKLEFYEIAFKTQQTLTKLADAIYPAQNIKLINSFSELEKTTTRLFKVISDTKEKTDFNSEYLKTLKDSQEILDQMVFVKDADDIYKTFKAVEKDFENKLKSINYGISSNANTSAKIKVTTDEDGYFVYIKYTYDFDKDIIRLRFNNPTNNAERELAPGYYIVWVEKGDYKSEVRYVDIVCKDDSYVNEIKF